MSQWFNTKRRPNRVNIRSKSISKLVNRQQQPVKTNWSECRIILNAEFEKNNYISSVQELELLEFKTGLTFVQIKNLFIRNRRSKSYKTTFSTTSSKSTEETFLILETLDVDIIRRWSIIKDRKEVRQIVRKTAKQLIFLKKEFKKAEFIKSSQHLKHIMDN